MNPVSVNCEMLNVQNGCQNPYDLGIKQKMQIPRLTYLHFGIR